jgi:hypothetical protein
MFTTRSFTKQAPVIDGVIFEVLGSNPKGFGLFIENQDDSRSASYYLEDSPDGIDYTRIEFSNGGDDNLFGLLPGQIHNVKVTSTAAHIRLRAYGDVMLGINITQAGDDLQTIAIPAPDLTIITVSTSSTAAVTSTSSVVLAANTGRLDATIVNYGSNGCFLNRGATAIAGQGIYLAANGGTYRIEKSNLFRGAIYAICSSGQSTTLSITEGS